MAFGKTGVVEHLHAWSLFGFLDLGDFKLLGEGFEHRLLDLGLAVQFGILNSEQGKLAQRRVEGIRISLADAAIVSAVFNVDIIFATNLPIVLAARLSVGFQTRLFNHSWENG